MCRMRNPTLSPSSSKTVSAAMKLSGLREAHLRVEGQTSAALVYGLTATSGCRFEFGQISCSLPVAV